MMAPIPPPKMILPNIPALTRDVAVARASACPSFLHVMLRSEGERRMATLPGVLTRNKPYSFEISHSASRTSVDRKSTRLNSSHHRDLHSFPTRRSSDLLRSEGERRMATLPGVLTRNKPYSFEISHSASRTSVPSASLVSTFSDCTV